MGMNRTALFVILSLAAMFPVSAQSLTGTLRTGGTVMISTGGEFIRAIDGQPVSAGMRLLVGEDGSASVEYGPDCKRSYDAAGTYTIAPGHCDNDRKQDDKSRKEDAQQSQAQGETQGGSQAGQGASAATGGSSGPLLTQLGIIGGTVAAGAAALEQQGNEVAPDQPVSR